MAALSHNIVGAAATALRKLPPYHLVAAQYPFPSLSACATACTHVQGQGATPIEEMNMLSTLSAISTTIAHTFGKKSVAATSTQGTLGNQTFTAQESPARATLRAPTPSNEQTSLPNIKKSENSPVKRHQRQKSCSQAEIHAIMNGPKERTYVGNCKRMIAKTKGHAANGAS